MALPRMRTIDQVVAYIKETDPESALTKTAVRRLVVSGQLQSKKVGNKYLVALEAVDAYLISPPPTQESPKPGRIRPVK